MTMMIVDKDGALRDGTDDEYVDMVRDACNQVHRWVRSPAARGLPTEVVTALGISAGAAMRLCDIIRERNDDHG